jgi:Fe-S oxidoreductase
MWAESSSEVGERLAQIRVRDAVELGAEILVTACPLCVLTLEDAVKTSGHEEKIEVLDVAELLVQAL